MHLLGLVLGFLAVFAHVCAEFNDYAAPSILIRPRDDSSSSQGDSSSSSSSQSDSGSSSSSSQSDDNNSSSSQDNSNSQSDSSSSSSGGDSTGSIASSATQSAVNRSTISINPQLPAGQIVLQTPTSTASTYVKVGEYATFSWTYSNILVSPTAVNVMLSCSQNQQTYTLAVNQSVDNQQFVWNTTDTDESEGKMITAQYTLIIWDNQLGPSQVAGAGYLTPLQYIFGVYRPQAYTPWYGDNTYINKALSLAGKDVVTATLLALGTVAFTFLL